MTCAIACVRVGLGGDSSLSEGTHLDEVGEFGIAASDGLVYVILELVLLRVEERHVILGEPRLALPVLKKDEADHGFAGRRFLCWVPSLTPAAAACVRFPPPSGGSKGKAVDAPVPQARFGREREEDERRTSAPPRLRHEPFSLKPPARGRGSPQKFGFGFCG